MWATMALEGESEVQLPVGVKMEAYGDQAAAASHPSLGGVKYETMQMSP